MKIYITHIIRIVSAPTGSHLQLNYISIDDIKEQQEHQKAPKTKMPNEKRRHRTE